MDNMSVSIENQMNICKQYINENGLTLYNIYIDDGYSGANFDRPGFQNMINDLEMKRFGCIIVKDLSRLGRNFLKVSYYIQVKDAYGNWTTLKDIPIASLKKRKWINTIYRTNTSRNLWIKV